MKKMYLLGIVMVGWSAVGWTMDGDGEFKVLSNPRDEKSYGAIDVRQQRTDRLAAIHAAGAAGGLIYKKDGEVITSLDHHPIKPLYAEGTTAGDGTMFFRQRGIGQVDGTIAKKKPTSPVLVKYSPNGRSIAASAGYDLVLVTDNKKDSVVLPQKINSIEFSSGSDWLIVSSKKDDTTHTLSFFDVDGDSPLSGASHLCTLEGCGLFLTTAGGNPEKLAWGGTGKIFYCTFDTGRVTGTLSQQNLISFYGTLHALSFTQDGKHLLLLRDNVVEQLNPATGTIDNSVAINNDLPHCLVPLYTDNSWLVGTEEGNIVNIDPNQGQASEYPTGLPTVALLSASQKGAIVMSDGKQVKSFCLEDQHKENQKKDYTIKNGILALNSVQQEKALKRRKRVRQCFCCCVGTLAVAALTVVTYVIRGQRAAN